MLFVLLIISLHRILQIISSNVYICLEIAKTKQCIGMNLGFGFKDYFPLFKLKSGCSEAL